LQQATIRNNLKVKIFSSILKLYVEVILAHHVEYITLQADEIYRKFDGIGSACASPLIKEDFGDALYCLPVSGINTRHKAWRRQRQLPECQMT